MLGKVLRAVLLAGIVGVLQSNALRFLSTGFIVPDIVLIVLVYFSHKAGSLAGQTAGFASGLLLDFISLAPLGYFAFVYTLIGFVFGITKDRVVLDGVVLPFFAVLLATLTKALVARMLAGIFSIDTAGIHLFGAAVWIEIGLSALLAPLLFAIMNAVGVFRDEQRGGFR